MNPLNLSPAAQMFWGSIIRHVLSAVGGILVAHGYVNQTGANAYTEELVGLALNGAVLAWSNRVAYWQRVKLLVALMLPHNSTENDVTAIIDSNAPKPSIMTPPNTAPGVAKVGVLVLACLLGAGAAVSLPACASAPPAGTYSAAGLKAWHADQLLKDLNALSQTAINLNGVSGPEHLKDKDTALVRDFSLLAGAAINAWGTGATTLQSARAAIDLATLPPGIASAARLAFDQAVADHGANASTLVLIGDVYSVFLRNVSIDAKQHPKLVAVLGAVSAGIASIPVQ